MVPKGFSLCSTRHRLTQGGTRAQSLALLVVEDTPPEDEDPAAAEDLEDLYSAVDWGADRFPAHGAPVESATPALITWFGTVVKSKPELPPGLSLKWA